MQTFHFTIRGRYLKLTWLPWVVTPRADTKHRTGSRPSVQPTRDSFVKFNRHFLIVALRVKVGLFTDWQYNYSYCKKNLLEFIRFLGRGFIKVWPYHPIVMLDVYIDILLKIAYIKNTWYRSGMAMDFSWEMQYSRPAMPISCVLMWVQGKRRKNPIHCRRTARVHGGGALKERPRRGKLAYRDHLHRKKTHTRAHGTYTSDKKTSIIMKYLKYPLC